MNQNGRAAFKLERNDKRASPLVQLPTELRLQILRMLLKHDGRLPVCEQVFTLDNQDDDEIVFGLSPHIVSSCQALYEDLYHILYVENTLCICFSRGAKHASALHINMLDADISEQNPFEDHQYRPLDVHRDLFDLNRYKYEGTRDLTDTLGIAARFTNTYVSFRRDASYLIASRVLRNLFRGKCVVVKLEQWSLSGKSHSHWLSGQHRKPHFSPACFAVWQCRSIKFLNGCRRGCCQNEYTELMEIITNEKLRVRDLCSDLWRLEDAVSQEIFMSPLSGFHSAKYLFQTHRRSLVYAVYNSDVLTFDRTREQVMIEIDIALSQHEANVRGKTEQRALGEILDVKTHLGFDEEERTVWVDYILSEKQHQIALIEEKPKDSRRLMYELMDEDDLLSEPCDTSLRNTTILDRVSYLSEEAFMLGGRRQKR